ncbi:type III-A CRISPR-associated protein Cas10/Csm1 [Desulfurobacterium atlanticum]|uniref:CRISPR system single-strand-specific deoxyribonuclease Cas10/Csm1 (subtype III-A) n=1 Tax=Desulfurobacterium atlanticum TaxID=240169 RepID=A0A238Y5E8_9BACT|nr:type III-A CRISPR-associated protein Cas10/Csm1 [Desulfurobacterium atlanticum]SNR65804.1 CRISPR-associated protein Cas10/Csm1, subtype III-A/MTUBE [Desulfurobacterium atlanticum]
MKKKRELEIVTTAALLHDIGKFLRRAKQKSVTHQEASELAVLNDLKQGLSRYFNEDEIKEIAAICRNHHYERDRIKGIDEKTKSVATGDRLSAGLDRHSMDKIEYEEKSATEKSLLISIFEEISFKENKKIQAISQLLGGEVNVKVYRFQKLTPDSAFPVEKHKYVTAETDYSNLWDEFVKEFNKIEPTENFNLFFEAMKSIIIKYTWCIPSSTYSPRGFTLPDVPLCDHLLSSAAIATATHRLKLENAKKSSFLILSGDFSGIQKFIFSRYGESKKEAAKILRAKSLAVSLALEIVIDEIVKTFNVNRSVILLNAGGKFKAILPDINGEEKIKTLKRKMEEKLIKNHYGILSINLAFVKAEEKDFEKENFRKKLEELSLKEAEEKFKTFEIKDTDRFAITNYIDSLHGEQPCEICGLRPRENSKNSCSLCNHLSDIGKNLPKSTFMVIKPSEKFYPLPEIELYEANDKEELLNRYREIEPDEDVLIFSIDDTVCSSIPVANINVHLPKNNGKIEDVVKICMQEKEIENTSIKTFEQLGCESLQEENGEIYGKPFIAVLKADVDNLGFIFLDGFLEERSSNENGEEKVNNLYSVSRVMYLSRMMNYFFTAVLTEKIKRDFPDIYTVFAGGDDLFLIGPWEQIIKFTKEMRKEFKRYTADNPDITISSGIFITKPSIPVYSLAEGGEEQLEIAKKKKNRVAVFNKSVTYEDFCKLLEISEKLEKEIKEGKVSTALAYRLIELSDMANKIYKNSKNALWKAYLSYAVYRNYGRNGKVKDEERERFLKDWIELIENFSQNISKKEKENTLYIAIAKALYRRRRYGKLYSAKKK